MDVTVDKPANESPVNSNDVMIEVDTGLMKRCKGRLPVVEDGVLNSD